jgi:biopolymer transport protein ExbD
MMGRFSSGDSDAPLSEINVTPLVDVMLVLLVIFIVAAPLMSQALKVDLPRAEAPQSNLEPDVITLLLHTDGHMAVNGERIASEFLIARLRELTGERTDSVVRFGADADVRYQAVAEVLSALQKAGVKHIAFATRSP